MTGHRQNDQTQFHMTATDLEIHQGFSSSVSKISQANATGLMAAELVCDDSALEHRARKSTRRDDGKLHELGENKEERWHNLCDSSAPDVSAGSAGCKPVEGAERIRCRHFMQTSPVSWRWRTRRMT